jgi:hypothetical protein
MKAISDLNMDYKIKNIGEFYDSGDFSIGAGEIVVIPGWKASQLLTDFPKNWELIESPKSAPTEKGKKGK